MDEFALIDTYFRPLARGFKGSLNLADDAAVIAPPPDSELVVTTDAISEGVHFIGNEDAGLIAQKLLRVNLSDLAAMGAKPLCYFLTIMIPPLTPPQAGGMLQLPPPFTGGARGRNGWLKRFAAGLAADQKTFRVHLAGGDTVSTHGAKSFSVTALGTIPKGKALKRSGAKVGDAVFVSGTLGDSALGLASLCRRFPPCPPASGGGMAPTPPLTEGQGGNFLERRYLLPTPRLALGQKLVGIANACMDISDGLVQDLGHICQASGVGATIHRDRLPLSKPARKLIGRHKTLWESVLSGGDDYELLFTVPPRKKAMIKKLAAALKLPLTEIGEITKGKGVKALNASGNIISLKYKGFNHFF